MDLENLHPVGCASENLHSADRACSSTIDLEAQLHVIGSLCQILDLIVSPNIEEEMVCPLACCLLKDAINYIDILTGSCVAENQSIIGDSELKLLHQMRELFSVVPYGHYDEKYRAFNLKGFSKEQHWLDFVNIVKKANEHLSLIISLFHLKDIMHSQGMGMVKRHHDTFDRLCEMLDFFVSPTIEEDIEEEECPLEVCCVGNHKVLPYFKQIIIQLDFLFFTESYLHKKQSILECTELKSLRQLYKTLKNIHHYNDKIGFSKKQQWLDLVRFVNNIRELLKSENIIEKCLAIINNLCETLDFFSLSNIEERMVFSLKQYAEDSMALIDRLIKSYSKETQSLLEDAELNLLGQLREKLFYFEDYYYDEEEKGFSKTQQWLDFIDIVNMANVVLKNAVKRYAEKTSG